MKIIGLCGGSGSGKGTVCSVFKTLGIPSIDTDAVYRDMVSKDSPCLRALTLEFGKEILLDDGSLNRKLLAQIVFSGDDKETKLKLLNSISHKYILEETERIIDKYKQAGYFAAIIDAPVLFESGFNKKCDLTICVIANHETRINRIVARDGITSRQASARIASQKSDEELISLCDYYIENNGDFDSLFNTVSAIKKHIFDN